MLNTQTLRPTASFHHVCLGRHRALVFSLMLLCGWCAPPAQSAEPNWNAPTCRYNFFVDQDDDPAVTNANTVCLTKGGGDCSLREALTALQDVNQNYMNVDNFDGQTTNAAYGVNANYINCIYIQPLSNGTGDPKVITLNGTTDLPTINYGVRIMPDLTVDNGNSDKESAQEPTTIAELVTINGNGRRIFTFSNDSSYTSWIDIRQLILKNGGATDGGLVATDSSTQVIRLYQCTLTRDATLPELNPGGAVRGTAVYVHDNVDLYMDRCTVTGIKANLNADVKGTIHVEGNGELFVTNSTITDNQAASGSAIYGRGAVTLTQTTISNNTGQSSYNGTAGDNCRNAAGRGAAVFMEKSVSDLLAITNTLITGNTNTFNPPQAAPVCTTEADCFLEVINGNTTITPVSRCSLYDDLGNCGTNTGDQQLDPLFTLDPLADNGGLTPTRQIGIDDPANPAVDGVNPTRDATCTCTPGTQCICSALIDQPGSTRPIGGYCDVGAVEDPTVPTCPGTRPVAPRVSPGRPDMGSHTTPTYLFIASYDWLHNFTDRNAVGARGGRQIDPDTDNFNKIIVADSNLFPIMTALVGDHEFPNITARNALSWRGNAAPYYSLYSPSVNDYFNRSIAVAPDFIVKAPVKYSIFTTICLNNAWSVKPTFRDLYQYGARSIMQWAFVTDPGNNNLRRYEFRKLGVSAFLDGSNNDYLNPIVPAPAGFDSNTVCSGNKPCPPENTWARGTSDQLMCGLNGGQLCNEADEYHTGETLLTLAKHNFTAFSNLAQFLTYINNATPANPDTAPCLEWLQTIPDTKLPYNKLKIVIQGNTRNASASVAVGINSRRGDPPGATVPSNRFCEQIFDQTAAGAMETPDTEEYGFYTGGTCAASALSINQSWDLDGNAANGVQIRIRFCPYDWNNGFVLRNIAVGESDSAFTVNYNGPDNQLETRWTVLTSFLETVPPKSFPGYPLYTSAGRTASRGAVGYGFTTNTTFASAKNVRFKDPRDVDVYRDMFDSQNKGPTYIFVADTGNSRIQVFMNATGIAGATNAPFPIRPVRVKVPNDSAVTTYKSNELGPRIHTGVNLTAIGLGDGRKGDWRSYTTVSGTSLATSGIPAGAGRGEFYYPHGIAVDQDPDTKDVYLFVADTYNHRIQIFRDTTGVSFQSINGKRFNFVFEEGWGTYPLQTTLAATPPGPFTYRYPKGIDVARFANNSSYLYVVDAKNYRVMKYLLTEGSAAEGITGVKAVAGYGYNGTTFVPNATNATNLTSMMGTPLTAHRAFETNSQLQAVGFLNPQDVSTGYSGFYLYSAPRTTNYLHQIETSNSRPLGVQFLNNYMFYVSDYARNHTSISLQRLNMRLMQFIDHPHNANLNGVFLPWQTDPNLVLPKGRLGQSVFGRDFGLYGSVPNAGAGFIEGASNNVPGRPGIFTERPLGMAALNWDTLTPFDVRVMNLSGRTVYPNGATIDNDTLLRVAARAREFFGLPYRNITSYTNFTSQTYNWDGYKLKRVHVFCYDTQGRFQNHTALHKAPFNFTPATVSTACTGYMKVIAEDTLFDHSGKTGTLIFKMTD